MCFSVRRCSGVNHCSYKLNLDNRESKHWGPGLVYIKYICMEGKYNIHFTTTYNIKKNINIEYCW